VTDPVRVRAPATTANIGPGFDCAAAALDLWNELVVSEGGEPDGEHLGVRAFALLADPSGLEFDFTVRIPRERGLGSSASIIALGLAAACVATGESIDAERLLALGLPLEGHADNLAAALAGGVCLTWDGHIARLADTLPFAPIAVVPETRVVTADARASLPEQIPHAAAAFTAAHAALLGAAIVSQDPDLFAAALHDELHEPYRAELVPAFGALRAELPTGAVGATISGSGPTVIVWARDDQIDACARELRARFADADVMPLRISAEGTQRSSRT
jgi:homoserine kinase